MLYKHLNKYFLFLLNYNDEKVKSIFSFNFFYYGIKLGSSRISVVIHSMFVIVLSLRKELKPLFSLPGGPVHGYGQPPAG